MYTHNRDFIFAEMSCLFGTLLCDRPTNRSVSQLPYGDYILDHVYSFWVFKLTCLQLAIPPCRFNVWGISLCFALTDSILHNTHSVRSHIFNSRLEIGPSPQQHYGHGEAFNLAT